jgi:hypothetical protein
MEATNSYSKAEWELQSALLKPPREYTQIFRRF